MIKRNFLLMLLAMMFAGMSAQKSGIKSDVREATVYLNGAFVVREAKVNLLPGSNKLVFSPLPANIEASSLQLSVEGTEEIVWVKTKAKFRKNPGDSILLLKLADTLASVRKSRLVNDTKLNLLKEEESIIRKNQPSFSSEYAIKTTELEAVVQFNRARLTDLFMTMLDLTAEGKRLDSLEYSMKLKMARIKNNRPEQWYEVESEVLSPRQSETVFKISYFTMFASWTPSYDLRVQDVASPVRLQMKASVTQHTGEKWEDVKLTVSNGSPQNSEVGPRIAPWYVRYFQRSNVPVTSNVQGHVQVRSVSGKVTDNAGEPVIFANVTIKENPEFGTTTDFDGRYYLPVPQGAKTIEVSYVGFDNLQSAIKSEKMDFVLSESSKLLEAVVTAVGSRQQNSSLVNGVATGVRAESVIKNYSALPVRITYQPTTFSFTLDKPCTVPASTVSSDYMVTTMEIPSAYRYWTVPKMEKAVFLTARLADWQKFGLLDADINLYLEGKYIGKSYLDTKSAADTLDISLGRDKNIIVERTMTRDFKKKNFLSNKIIVERKYTFEIRNNKGQPVSVMVQDHLPLSTDKSIEVYDTEVSKGKSEQETGIVTWQFDIKPGSSVTCDMSYSLKYSGDKWVDLD